MGVGGVGVNTIKNTDEKQAEQTMPIREGSLYISEAGTIRLIMSRLSADFTALYEQLLGNLPLSLLRCVGVRDRKKPNSNDMSY